MTYSIFKRLSLAKSTNISLQLANYFIKYPLGILEDAPIKVGEFYMPIDFVILDMIENSSTQSF